MNDMSVPRLEPPVAQVERLFHGWRPEGCDRVALVLQGGGALGAYQAGVYQALHESGIEPDWVSGVSIGAINAAIIAGNVPDQRLSRLRTFWELITDRKIWPFTPDGDIFRKARNATSSWMTMIGGQPGFFEPRVPGPWLSFTGAQTATSYYDNGPLRETLLQLADFSIINSQAIRLAVGAVNVLTGNFVYFDNAREPIEPEHVMASGALPPALPMMKIGTDHYWDGGSHQHAGVPGRPFQRARRAATRHSGRHGPPQGHHVFLAHALQHRRLSPDSEMEDALLPGLDQGPGRHLERG